MRGRAVGIDKTIKRLKKNKRVVVLATQVTQVTTCCPFMLQSTLPTCSSKVSVCMLGSAWSQRVIWKHRGVWWESWDPPPAKLGAGVGDRAQPSWAPTRNQQESGSFSLWFQSSGVFYFEKKCNIDEVWSKIVQLLLFYYLLWAHSTNVSI